MSVADRAWLVLNACHLEKFVGVRGDPGTRQAFFFDRNGSGLEGAWLAHTADTVDGEAVEDLVHFSLVVCRSEVGLEQVTIPCGAWIRAYARMFGFERAWFRPQVRYALVVLPR